MSRRRGKNKVAWGQGKHRKARIKRFAARNPDSKKVGKK